MRKGTACAVKVSKRQFRCRAEREQYMHELESVACVEEHPHVVRYYSGWQQGGHLYIHMELCEGGNMREMLDARQAPLSNEEVRGGEG